MSDPIIPSSAAEFDAALSALPPGSTIELEPKLYWTRGYLGGPGDLDLKAGTKILGNGATLKVDRNPVFHSDVRPDPKTRNITILRGVADDIEVSDLTLDAACDGSETVSQFGTFLGGNNCALRHCKVINVGGNLALGQESFAITVGGEGTLGGLVSHCEVSSATGTYLSAVNMTGQGRIEYNQVRFPEMKLDGPRSFWQGILPAGTSNCVVSGNLVENGLSGVYGDSGSERNLEISGNTFINVCLGVAIVKSASQENIVDGLLIKGNTILLSNTLADFDRGGIRIVESGPQFYRNIKLLHNRIGWYQPGGSAKAYAFCVWSETPTGENLYDVRIADNTVDRDMEWRLKCKDLVLDNNRDFEGNPIKYPSFVTISQ